jgi:hypothetical protein
MAAETASKIITDNIEEKTPSATTNMVMSTNEETLYKIYSLSVIVLFFYMILVPLLIWMFGFMSWWLFWRIGLLSIVFLIFSAIGLLYSKVNKAKDSDSLPEV